MAKFHTFKIHHKNKFINTYKTATNDAEYKKHMLL